MPVYDMALCVSIRITETELVLAMNSVFLVNIKASDLESAVFIVFERAAGASSIASLCVSTQTKIDHGCSASLVNGSRLLKFNDMAQLETEAASGKIAEVKFSIHSYPRNFSVPTGIPGQGFGYKIRFNFWFELQPPLPSFLLSYSYSRRGQTGIARTSEPWCSSHPQCEFEPPPSKSFDTCPFFLSAYLVF
ncbi:uncharacterized protein ARMOST_15858 [Armillaria ostoyae]|uniref:Uncharacterized protein n=1 Tax=Armillaria ostoyae TaxID=47428 RepID=A0A284RUJ5_ARMOS|nr:uncharacterized protein ARMOST_15858 [Armillaria ostoyae]